MGGRKPKGTAPGLPHQSPNARVSATRETGDNMAKWLNALTHSRRRSFVTVKITKRRGGGGGGGGGSVACSECRNVPPSVVPLLSSPLLSNVRHSCLTPHSLRACITFGRAFCDLAKETETQWFGRSGKCTRDLLERLPMGHNRATNERTNARAKKEKPKMVRKGGGPRVGRPINNTSADFLGSFSRRKKRQVQAEARERAVPPPRRSRTAFDVASPFDLRAAGRKYVRLLCKLFAPGPAIFLTAALTDDPRITRDLRLTVLVIEGVLRRVKAREICGSLRCSNMRHFKDREANGPTFRRIIPEKCCNYHLDEDASDRNDGRRH